MSGAKISNEEIHKLSSFGVKVAKEKFGISLDYTKNSLYDLDKLLENAYQRFNELALEGKLSDESVERTSKIWGSYLGEVIQMNYGGYWVEENNIQVLIVNNTTLDPIDFVKSRIKDKPHLNSLKYYENSASIVLSSLPSEKDATEIVDEPVPSFTEEERQSSTKDIKSETKPKKRSNWIYFIIIIFVVIIGIFIGSNLQLFSYRPNSEDAYSYAKEIVHKELYPSNHDYPGCEHRTTSYQIKVEEKTNNRYFVEGAVVAANWACVKDVSYFTLNVYYDEQDEAYHHSGSVSFSNRCVTTESSEKNCFQSLWSMDWKPGDPATKSFKEESSNGTTLKLPSPTKLSSIDLIGFYDRTYPAMVDFTESFNNLENLLNDPMLSEELWFDSAVLEIQSLIDSSEQAMNVPVPTNCEMCQVYHDQMTLVFHKSSQLADYWGAWKMSLGEGSDLDDIITIKEKITDYAIQASDALNELR